MSLTTVFIVAYVIGTLLGIWFGYKSGVKTGADLMMETLMQSKFLLYKRKSDGEIEIIKPEKPAEITES